MNARAPALLDRIKELIRLDGPIGVDRYIGLALGDPAQGYYMTRDPFGAAGDFTTAPEISQMFGEMLGLWAAEVWGRMGSPVPVRLVELGPGRGTLMADLLRAARVVPAFWAALDLHLVETSPVLRELQAATLAGSGVAARWHASIETVPEGPVLVIANEFFDALPVRQFCRTDRGWCERLVGIGPDGGLAFGLSPVSEPSLTMVTPEGAVLEVATEAQRVMRTLAGRIGTHGGAALIVDYGHAPTRCGETLQAMRRHGFVDPLHDPGEADLTTHVDFAALARSALAAGAAPHGPVPQGAFLRRLGIEARAARLRAARPEHADAVTQALRRLIEPGTAERPGMGELFKVLAVVSRGTPEPPGFGANPNWNDPSHR